jgi:hypothetical protein
MEMQQNVWVPVPVVEIRTQSSVYVRRADGIVVQTPIEGTTQTLDDAKENVTTFQMLTEGRQTPLLVDGRPSYRQKPGVREYYASPAAAKNLAAMALLIGSSSGRFLFNLFLALSRPSTPTRVFTSEQEAITWLLRFRRF